MFEDIIEQQYQHVSNIRQVYLNSQQRGLSPTKLAYRPLDKQDFNKLFHIVDLLQYQLSYDHLSGACLFVHYHLKRAFAAHGYASEMIFGDVVVNGQPYMECGLKELTDQLNEGIVHGSQKVHSWLLLENGQFFDVTLVRDLTDGKMAAELYCFGIHDDGANILEYKPVLASSEFVLRTNPVPQAHI